MRYLGNQPAIQIEQTFSRNRWDFVVPGNPTVDVNPSAVNCTWLNIATGEEFICVDNTVDGNIWRGQTGSTITPLSTTSLNIINYDASEDPTIGWTNELGTLKRRGTSGAPSGGYYFYSTDAQTIARQTLDISAYSFDVDFVGAKIALQYWYSGYSGDNDGSQIGVRFRDSMQNVFTGDSYSLLVEDDTNTWYQVPEYESAIPVGARFADILMKLTRMDGVDNNGYMDDITATIKPVS